MLTKAHNLEAKSYLDKEFEDCFLPKGNRIVARSPSFSIIMTKILCGEKPEAISVWLKKHEREVISATSLRDYTKKYVPEKLRINPDLVRWLHSHGCAELDELTEFTDILLIQKRRVMALIENERSHSTRRILRYNKNIRHELSALNSLLMSIVNLKKDLGILGDSMKGMNVAASAEETTTVVISKEKTEKEEIRITKSCAVKLAGSFMAKRKAELADE